MPSVASNGKFKDSEYEIEPMTRLPTMAPINPWASPPVPPASALPANPPYVLPADATLVAGVPTFVTHILPEPWIGDPLTAHVILLLLNPGFLGSELEWHTYPPFAAAVRAALAGTASASPYPFYFLDPALTPPLGSRPAEMPASSCPGVDWWIGPKRATLAPMLTQHPMPQRLPSQPHPADTRVSIALPGSPEHQKVSQRLASIELIPYHSQKAHGRFHKLCTALSSAAYTLWLVDQAILRGAIIVVTRSLKLWNHALSHFGYSLLKPSRNCLQLRSCQNVVLSERNFPTIDDFDRTFWALRG